MMERPRIAWSPEHMTFLVYGHGQWYPTQINIDLDAEQALPDDAVELAPIAGPEGFKFTPTYQWRQQWLPDAYKSQD